MMKKTCALALAAVMLLSLPALAQDYGDTGEITVMSKDFSKTGTAGQTLYFSAADFEDYFEVLIPEPTEEPGEQSSEGPSEGPGAEPSEEPGDETVAPVYGGDDDGDDEGHTGPGLESITLTELPDETCGILRVGSETAAAGTPITDYGNLNFVPASDDACETTFSWKGTSDTGHTSETAGVVTLTLELPEPPPPVNYYADMTVHWAAPSANKFVDLGILVGEKIGGRRYFRPDMNITRGDFILLVAAALGIEPASTDVPYFSDYVPSYLIKISNAFHAKGLLNGVPAGGDLYELRYNQPLTRIEAFAVINNALELEDAVTQDLDQFSDAYDVPGWGLQVMKNMVGYKITVGSQNAHLYPNVPVTRGQAVVLLDKAYMELHKDEEEP
ncbi:MAG: S-layer homology domain-containing protein [Oscillospiraceae bacterium]|nr:S-layer homology domain-containing protein [Oscillospiraceae bacterium]